jgi:siroheme synthase (precorrin-2 oxidase/ferrochelatase)
LKKYFPINLDVEGKKCVVVGTGKVGTRKAEKLKAFGADVVAVDKNYKASDIEGAYLVFAATNDDKVNAQISKDAKRLGVLVNVADSARESDFIMPALLEKQGLTVTVCSSGLAPARSVKVRDEIKGYRFKS